MPTDALYKRKSINRSFEIKRPGDLTAVAKKIEKMVANESAKTVRSRIIDSAYLIRDTVADSAPKPIYTRIILGEPLERFENKNSGFDVSLNSGMNMSFELRLSTSRFSKGRFSGYNPMIGLLNSNYGRRAFTISGGGAPIPIDEVEGKKPYNHPTYGFGHNSMYEGKDVIFVKKIKGITGTNWIEEAVQKSSRKANNVLAGTTTYGKRRNLNRFWG